MKTKNFTKLEYLYFIRFRFNNQDIQQFIKSGYAEYLRNFSENHHYSEVKNKLREICKKIKKEVGT
ncbi:hypothetical protein DRN73_05255 [Candidatus Pacearchaeota archaeon]|nr:MAG: hypothetical protein DRN73_05255 [Candidatus Pacearchaeota archaeon]